MTFPFHRRKIQVFGGLLFVAVLLLTPFVWHAADQWVQGQRSIIWSRLEASIGQKVTYGRISPAVLDGLEFQNVIIKASDGTPVVTAGSVRFSWDWAMVFQGKFDLALRKVHVINVSLQIDTRRDSELIGRWSALLGGAGSLKSSANQFEVEGFNLTARWTDGIKSLKLDRVFFLLSPEGDMWGLKYRGAVGWEDRSDGGSYARFMVRGDLKSDSVFQNLSLRTEVFQAQTTWFDLAPLTFQVSVDPGAIRVTKVADRIPLDLKAVLDRKSNLWSFSGSADGFRPSDVFRWKLQHPWDRITDGSVKGDFSFVTNGDFAFNGQAFWPQGTLPVPFDRESVLAQGEIRTGHGQFQFQHFRLESKSLALRFEGTLDPKELSPNGTLILDHWTVPSAGEARGTVRFVSEGARVLVLGDGWHWNEIGASSPTGWVEKKGTLWGFHLEGNLDDTPSGRFDLGGSVDSGSSSGSLLGSITGIPFSQFKGEVRRHLPTVEIPGDLWDLVGSLRGTLGWGPGVGTATKATFEIHDPDRSQRSFTGIFGWQANHLTVGIDPIRWDKFTGGVRFDADFRDDGAIDAAIKGRLWDRPFSLNGRWSPLDQTLVFSGNPGMKGLVHKTSPGVWKSELTLEPLEILPGMTLGFRGRAQLDEDSWNLDFDQVTYTGKYPWNQKPFTLEGHVLADSSMVRVVGLTVTDNQGVLAGGGSTSWDQSFSRPWEGSMNLGTPGTNRENFNVAWQVAGWKKWHIGIKAGGIDLGRLEIPAVKGVTGRLALDGNIDWAGGEDILWSVQSSLSEARWGDSPLGCRALIAGTSNHVSVKNLNLSASPFHITDGAFDLDSVSRTWEGGGVVGMRMGTVDWTSRWLAAGYWPPEGISTGGSFSLDVKENQWSHKELPDWRLKGGWGTDHWEAYLEDGGVVASGFSDGSFFIHAKDPFPVGGEARGIWHDGRINLAVQNFKANLDLVKDFISSKPFSVKGGLLEGNFTVEGAMSDPEFNGRILLRNLQVASSFIRPVLGPTDVPVILEGHQILIEPVNLGPKGQFWLVSAEARLDHFLPESYELTVRTDALSAIPAVYEGSGIAATGSVTGYFQLTGTPLAVTLGGRLVCQDTSITLKDSKADPTGGTPLGFNVDLTLITGRKVEFLWPNESLPLIRAVTATDQPLVIKSNDVASTWSVNGKLVIKTGEINYLNQTFVIKNGVLGFQESQMNFDPHLSVKAELKVPETTGTITVNLHADGTLATFSPRFDSTPYMSSTDLQQLLGITLALPSDYSKSTSLNTALSVASDVGTSMLLSPFEQLVRRNFQLDLFTVRTEILKRTFLNQNGPSGASDYLDNTRLFFGKYIGDDLFLQGTLAFSQDPLIVNQGSTQLIADPEFQMEFQTPFFLLNWTLEPQHPETLFVTDNTVTFRWNWSY